MASEDIMNDKAYIEELRQQIQEMRARQRQEAYAREELEQQLAQAREENLQHMNRGTRATRIIEQLEMQVQETLKEQARLAQEHAAMRALLELVIADSENRTDLTLPQIRQQIRALLNLPR